MRLLAVLLALLLVPLSQAGQTSDEGYVGITADFIAICPATITLNPSHAYPGRWEAILWWACRQNSDAWPLTREWCMLEGSPAAGWRSTECQDSLSLLIGAVPARGAWSLVDVEFFGFPGTGAACHQDEYPGQDPAIVVARSALACRANLRV